MSLREEVVKLQRDSDKASRIIRELSLLDAFTVLD